MWRLTANGETVAEFPTKLECQIEATNRGICVQRGVGRTYLAENAKIEEFDPSEEDFIMVPGMGAQRLVVTDIEFTPGENTAESIRAGRCNIDVKMQTAFVAANDNHQGGRYIGLTRRGEIRPATPDIPDQEVRQGDWMQTYTGRKFWPLDPCPAEVFIEDIAHSLSLQCRYAGHCRRFYSVAEHSVLLARWLRGKYGAMTALYGLLHDASEAYLVDVPRPVKPSLTGYKEVEAKVQAAVFLRFGLLPDLPDTVHDADNRIIGDELVNLQPMEWHSLHSDKLGVPIMLWSPAEAEEEFMWTFRALMDQTADVRAGSAA